MSMRNVIAATALALAFPNQHYNSTTSWAVDSKGEITHVYA